MDTCKNTFLTFCQTISILRSKKGCPWDQKQTSKSLKKYLQEECKELIDAIDTDDSSHICEESGDLLFLLVLLSKIHEETGNFNMEDVIRGINEKMIRRHPHVFGDVVVKSEEDLKILWETIKSEEKAKKTN